MNLENVIAVRKKKTVYRDDDKCIKVFDTDYSKADVLNEALNQARVEETGLNIPKIKEVVVIDGKWAIVSEFIEGKTLDKLMKENPSKKEEYLDLFVNIQMEILEKTCPLLTKLKDKFNRKIKMADIDSTTRYELHSRLNEMPKHSKLCHGDFNPSNIIIGDDGKNYILDWSHVTQGNAGADAARTYLLFWLKGDVISAELYLNKFCDKTGLTKEYIQKWMPIVATTQSVKGHEKERDFLLSWVNMVEYD